MSKRLTWLIACAWLASGWLVSASAQDNCKADNETRVAAGGECLALRTFRPAKPGPTLVVFLHGNVSTGGAADYAYRWAQAILTDGMVAAVILRPGYFDSAGNRSSGGDFGRGDNFTSENIDAVATAVKALKAHHKAAKVILVGHSGGAATAGVILGRHPGLADGAVLVGCPCNVPEWRMARSGGPWKSLSPHSYADGVPPPARVIAVTGSRDNVTYPNLAEDYIKSLARRGLKARYAQAEGANHNNAVTAPETAAALKELLAD